MRTDVFVTRKHFKYFFCFFFSFLRNNFPSEKQTSVSSVIAAPEKWGICNTRWAGQFLSQMFHFLPDFLYLLYLLFMKILILMEFSFFKPDLNLFIHIFSLCIHYKSKTFILKTLQMSDTGISFKCIDFSTRQHSPVLNEFEKSQ